MRKKLQTLFSFMLCAVLLAGVGFLQTAPAKAAGTASMTVSYVYDSTPVANATLKLYHVASIQADGTYLLDERYGGKYDLNDKEKFSKLPDTIKSYIQSKSYQPDGTMKTDANGQAKITGMEPGLYLLTGDKLSTGGYTYTPMNVLIDLRTELSINTKATRTSNGGGGGGGGGGSTTVSRKVLKQWDDKGEEASRPSEITVHLLKDGEEYASVKLNEKNNWKYTWTGLAKNDKSGSAIIWSVSEDVPEGYTVTSIVDGTTFVVTNSVKPTTPDNPPSNDDPPPPNNDNPPPPNNDNPPPEENPSEDKPVNPTPEKPTTGNSSSKPPKLPQTGQLWWPVPVLICGGLICYTIGVYRRRNDS